MDCSQKHIRFFLVLSLLFASVARAQDKMIVCTVLEPETITKPTVEALLQICNLTHAAYKQIWNTELPPIKINPNPKGKLPPGAVASTNAVDTVNVFINMLDIWTFSHELGHIMIGKIENPEFGEAFADILALPVAQQVCKELKVHCAYKTLSPFYRSYSEEETLFAQIQKKYDVSVISQIAQKMRAEFLKTNKSLPGSFIQKTFHDVTKDNTIVPLLKSYFKERILLQELQLIVKKGKMGLEITDIIRPDFVKLIGLRKGDVLLEFNGIKLNTPGDLSKALYTVPYDEPTTYRVLRHGNILTLKGKHAVYYESFASLYSAYSSSWLELKSKHLKVKYSRIPESMVKTCFKIWELAYDVYTKEFRIKLPQTLLIYFEKKDSPPFTRNVGYVEPNIIHVPLNALYYGNDLSYTFREHRLLYNLYDPFFHLLFLNEKYLGAGLREYLFSQWVVPAMYKRYGNQAVPGYSNYLTKEGPEALLKLIHVRELPYQKPNFTKEIPNYLENAVTLTALAAKAFYDIEKKYSRAIFPEVFKKLPEGSIMFDNLELDTPSKIRQVFTELTGDEHLFDEYDTFMKGLKPTLR